jgi:hypothetical protein
MFHPVVRTDSCWYATTAALRRPSLIARRAAAAGDLDPGRRLLRTAGVRALRRAAAPPRAARRPLSRLGRASLSRYRQPSEEPVVHGGGRAGGIRFEVGGSGGHLAHHVDLEHGREPSELDAELSACPFAGPRFAASATGPRRSFAEVPLGGARDGAAAVVSGHRATSETVRTAARAAARAALRRLGPRRARGRSRSRAAVLREAQRHCRAADRYDRRGRNGKRRPSRRRGPARLGRRERCGKRRWSRRRGPARRGRRGRYGNGRRSCHHAVGTEVAVTAGDGQCTASAARRSTGARACATDGDGRGRAEPAGLPGDVWSWD